MEQTLLGDNSGAFLGSSWGKFNRARVITQLGIILTQQAIVFPIPLYLLN